MPQISPKLFERLCKEKGWHPYIKSTVMVFGKGTAKYEMAFKESPFTSTMPMSRGAALLGVADERGDERRDIKCGACGHVGIIVGDCATECESCGASVNMDTGEPYRNQDGTLVMCGTFGGRHI